MKKTFALITSFFFLWGFVTVLNNILIPHFKSFFALNFTEIMLIQFSFFIAYGLFSLPSGWVIEKLGYKSSMLLSLFISSLGAFSFLPAIDYVSYPLFLLAIFILSSGIVLLQVSANPFIALLGEEDTASSRLNLAQGFNSLGTTIAPAAGSALILSPLFAGNLGVEKIYTSLGILFLFTACFVYFANFPEIAEQKSKTTFKGIFRYPHLLLGSLGIFFYVGAEVGIGSFLALFLEMETSVSRQLAGTLVSIYWGGAMVGRFLGFLLLLKFRAEKLLALHALFALIFVGVAIFVAGIPGAILLLAIGLFNSIMFPTIFTLSIAGLKDFVPLGSGLLCTAILGGAILPLLQGVFADSFGIHLSLFIPFLSYLYIFFFAQKGCRVRVS